MLETGPERRPWLPGRPPGWWVPRRSPRWLARLRHGLRHRLPHGLPGRLTRWDRRWRLAAIAGLVVAVLAGTALVVADSTRRDAENDRLDACVRDAFAATDAARNRVAGLAGFVQPGLREDSSDATATSLYAILAASARRAEPVVEKVRRSCAGIAVRSWHAPQLRTQTTVLAYLDLVLESFRAVSGNGREYFERNADLLRARRAVSRAQAMADGAA